MHVAEGPKPERHDDAVVERVLKEGECFVLVSTSRISGGVVDRTASALAQDGFEVDVASPDGLVRETMRGAVIVIYVRPDRALDLVRTACDHACLAVWLGPGLVNAEARAHAEEHPTLYVEDRDLLDEYEVRVKGKRRHDFIPI